MSSMQSQASIQSAFNIAIQGFELHPSLRIVKIEFSLNNLTHNRFAAHMLKAKPELLILGAGHKVLDIEL